MAVRPFGGMKKMRTWFAADKTGFHMLHTLFQTSLKYPAVARYDEWFVTKLLLDDGRVQGVVAMDLMSGRVEAITAPAVILCTGGCGKVFPFTTNANIKRRDGMALAYRAGAPLKDMEFVQYHPTGLPFTGILITEAARAEGGLLINKDGYRPGTRARRTVAKLPGRSRSRERNRRRHAKTGRGQTLDREVRGQADFRGGIPAIAVINTFCSGVAITGSLYAAYLLVRIG